MTSGTTGQRKYIPISGKSRKAFGESLTLWATMLMRDHPEIIGSRFLQLTTDWQEEVSESGVACGALSGFLNNIQPFFIRDGNLIDPWVCKVESFSQRMYISLLLALVEKDIRFFSAATPHTLASFAELGSECAEDLIKDMFDGSCKFSAHVDQEFQSRFKKYRRRRRDRARQLERICEEKAGLFPRDYWPRLSVIGTWIGGAFGLQRSNLRRLFGDVQFRDLGLFASEGHFTIPLMDNSAEGILNLWNHYFEFIPKDQYGRSNPLVVGFDELTIDGEFYVVVTNANGLIRYQLGDLVRCTGKQGEVPVVRFLRKSEDVSDLTGEKLSMDQVVLAFDEIRKEFQLPEVDFVMRGSAQPQPRYVLHLYLNDATERDWLLWQPGTTNC